jgi:hypothetical protein
VTTPGDESRTELAWREIVEHYGERPALDDKEPTGADDGAALAADVSEPEPLTEDVAETDEVEDEVPEVERFQPPAAPPFPRPRTWQRGLAWAGIFVAPALALLIGLLSVYVPALVGWVLVLWFVGGFLYLVREMPRAPRDPWDDGSRI